MTAQSTIIKATTKQLELTLDLLEDLTSILEDTPAPTGDRSHSLEEHYRRVLNARDHIAIAQQYLS